MPPYLEKTSHYTLNTKTHYSFNGYRWEIEQEPTDKSGYFMPYYKEQLQRKLKALKRNKALNTYNATSKEPYKNELTQMKNKIKRALKNLFENFDNLSTKDPYLTGIEELTKKYNKYVSFDFSKYDNLADLENDIKELKNNTQKVLFFYDIERITKYKYACLHQYKKAVEGEYYEMIEKYKNNAFWGDSKRYTQIVK